ncbi:hypothetical protein PA15_0302135 [Pseudomonas aeruginosa HB15]|uniref:Uncharacterized protein n=3 Tax=Burkholderiales TaxID=80840 RepID=A0A1R1JM08_ALCXX|nr:hypothetical protein A9Y76_10465 [Ralstonia insidiosa]AOV01772.1 hypothetical protein BI380_10595 [Delftia tsuruhatensis]EPX97246.1 hypothetical protein C404_14620 [Ralstonia sp. AU12-08]ESQ67107.1 hypothetical protein PA15_0302135 [Pseudomonas aeruginosa HB15]EWH30094.1 hypothetical protein Z695_0112835 [Pseudomonas aeruginosa SG17M]KQJ56470.1 hypothetical protein AN280_09635 [Pseudomonas aeruginosa]KUJ06010.1 hypothetical protein AR275_19470 [Stenotrophomonas maltophilia]OFL43194.1 hypo
MPEGRSSACQALRRSMCSSMWREFGLTGDWRSQASQVVLPLSWRLSRSSRRCRWVADRGSDKAA